MNKSINTAENEIIEEFSIFDNWADKYEYIIELGKKLEKLPDEFKTDEYKVRGCQSSVWLVAENKNGLIYFKADSDSFIVKGLISLLLRVLSGRTPDEIIDAELNFIDKIGLKQHLAQTRVNGLAAMIKQIKMYAVGYKSTDNTANSSIMEKEKNNDSLIISDSSDNLKNLNDEKSDKTDLHSLVVEALRSVYDPEIPVNIYELGLIYSIKTDDNGKVEIDMTLTSPACPVAGSLPPEVEAKIKAIPGVKECIVNVVWDPPWDMSMMSEEAKLQLNLF